MKFNQAGARVEQARAEPNVISASALDVKVMKFNQASCADLPVSEEQLIASGKHVLMSYIMKPEAGYDRTATRTSP